MSFTYFTNLNHPTQQALIRRVAFALHRVEKELDANTYWLHTRTIIKERDEWGNLISRERTAEEYSDPLSNLDYQSSMLETIGTELQAAEENIAELEDEATRSAIICWFSVVYRRFFDVYEAHSKVMGAAAD